MAKSSSPKCWKTHPENCAIHGVALRAAKNGDINAYLAAKEKEEKSSDMKSFFGEEKDYNSRGATTPQDTINLDGKVYNYNSLTDAGIAPERVREALTRPWGETGKPATKSQKENRVNFMVKEKEYYDKHDEIVNKKFGIFTSDKAKKEFYKKELKNLDDIGSSVVAAFYRVQHSERPEGYSYTPPRSQYHDEGEPQIESLPEYEANEKLKESWFGLMEKVLNNGGIL